MDRPAPSSALGDVVVRWAGRVREDGPHRSLSGDVSAHVGEIVTALLDADPDRLVTAGDALGLAPVPVPGWTVVASDPAGERSWLLLATRTGVVPDVLVEVPHPRADLRTEEVGWAIARRTTGALLLQAVAHRRAGAAAGAPARDCPADVAHRPDSLFARVADGLVAATGMPQVQLHGFADRADGLDVVVSGGAADEGPLVGAVADGLAAAGERVGRGTDPACAELAGTRNVQGRSAARHGAAFVHLELSRSLRRDPERRDRVGVVISRALSAR